MKAIATILSLLFISSSVWAAMGLRCQVSVSGQQTEAATMSAEIGVPAKQMIGDIGFGAVALKASQGKDIWLEIDRGDTQSMIMAKPGQGLVISFSDDLGLHLASISCVIQ